MHLWIPEVVHIIFEYVYDPDRTEDDTEGRITVAGLARTCRAFSDPALDVLWAQLHSLDPLVLCSGGRRVNNNTQVVWDRPLYDADWHILASYAKRVRTLTVSPQTPSSDPQSVRKCAAVASLAPSCPLLEDLLCKRAEASSMQAISAAVVDWKKLQTLDVGPINGEALMHASSLQTLQTLYFSTTADITSHVFEFCSPRADILIFTPTPSSFQAFMQNIHLLIQRLNIYCSLHDDLFPHLFFSHLKECVVHPEKLTQLSLTIETVSAEDASNESIILNSRMLHPLLSFKGLDHLDLGYSCTAHIDDTFLRELALSCPRLEELYLGIEEEWLISPLLTFDGVVSLLKHCRQLTSLGIFFNATFKSDAIYMAPVDAVSPKIIAFYVGASPIDEALKVAAVLSFLFPCATEISHFIENKLSNELQGRREKWETVQNMFKIFISARKQSWEQGWAEGKAAVEKIAIA